MRAQLRPKSLVLPLGEKKTGWKAQTCNIPFVQAKKSRFLLALTSLTWIVAAFVSFAFYFAVRSKKSDADWLACILLGMVFLGWILLASYFHASGKMALPTGKGERNDPHRPAPTATAARKD